MPGGDALSQKAAREYPSPRGMGWDGMGWMGFLLAVTLPIPSGAKPSGRQGDPRLPDQ